MNYPCEEAAPPSLDPSDKPPPSARELASNSNVFAGDWCLDKDNGRLYTLTFNFNDDHQNFTAGQSIGTYAITGGNTNSGGVSLVAVLAARYYRPLHPLRKMRV